MKASALGRNLSMGTQVPVTSQWPWVATLTTSVVSGGRMSNLGGAITEDGSFHLPADMHPATFPHCHRPLLRIFFPHSQVFLCLACTSVQPHGEGGSRRAQAPLIHHWRVGHRFAVWT